MLIGVIREFLSFHGLFSAVVGIDNDVATQGREIEQVDHTSSNAEKDIVLVGDGEPGSC